MSDDVQVIECSQCGRLHEVASGETRIECECGQVLDDSASAAPKAATDPATDAVEEAASPSPSLLERLRTNWRTLSIVGAVLIAAGLLLAFLHSPGPTFAELKFKGRGGLAAKDSRIDVETCLRILEDDARTKEHLAAADELLQSPETEFLIKRLSEMVVGPQLASRELIIRMLGQMGDDRALPVLENLLTDGEHSIVQLTASAMAQIDSASAESVLREQFADPAWAREMLPAVSMVNNDTAARLVASCLKRPELRLVAIKEIRLSKMERCLNDLIAVASDRSVIEPDRVLAIEALGTFEGKAARRGLANLLEDTKVGWKARQVLDEKGRL